MQNGRQETQKYELWYYYIYKEKLGIADYLSANNISQRKQEKGLFYVQPSARMWVGLGICLLCV